MTEYATIQFRAKRLDNVTRWEDNPAGGSTFTEGHTAYNVPKLTSSHVVTPRTEQGTRHVLMFGGRASADILKSRTETLLKRNGLDPYRIFTSDHDGDKVTITPDKGGFMATITLRVALAA